MFSDLLVNNTSLGVYKLDDSFEYPSYGTDMSACFDLPFQTVEKVVQGYDKFNSKIERPVVDGELRIYPQDRLLVPTGLIFKVVGQQCSIRLHPRSGLSLKKGLVLANAEGVVDFDYQQQVFVILTNISEMVESIRTGDRIAQGEVVHHPKVPIKWILWNPPTQHGERSGGFGSTGT